MNARPKLQSIVARFLTPYQQQHALNARHWKVLRHISQCRTPALGGHAVHCDQCGYQQPHYHSCRDRHCPHCQQDATQRWSERQLNHVLPVTYYHVVFTLPHELNAWVACHSHVIYRCLFAAVWHTLKAFGADKKRLAGEMGMSAVLHTWAQNLIRHVHLHCLIPGGALSADGHWHPAKSNYLFPVRALSRHFRGVMVSALRRAHSNGELPLLDEARVTADLNQLMQKDWVVYSKAYIKKADTVVNYLARYTHRIAISESRLQAISDEGVVLSVKDRDRRDGQHRTIHLTGIEFLRRFLLHVLPQGFMRVRHYGFLANRIRESKLAQIRAALATTTDPKTRNARGKTEAQGDATSANPVCHCPQCHKGTLRVLYEIAPQPLHGR